MQLWAIYPSIRRSVAQVRCPAAPFPLQVAGVVPCQHRARFQFLVNSLPHRRAPLIPTAECLLFSSGIMTARWRCNIPHRKLPAPINKAPPWIPRQRLRRVAVIRPVRRHPRRNLPPLPLPPHLRHRLRRWQKRTRLKRYQRAFRFIPARSTCLSVRPESYWIMWGLCDSRVLSLIEG